MSTEHVLDTIEDVINWHGSPDAMVWSPPERAPARLPATAPRNEIVRLTLIAEIGDRVETYDIPNPNDTTLRVDTEYADDPYGLIPLPSTSFQRSPTTTITVKIEVGDDGFTLLTGREMVAGVLRRITGGQT